MGSAPLLLAVHEDHHVRHKRIGTRVMSSASSCADGLIEHSSQERSALEERAFPGSPMLAIGLVDGCPVLGRCRAPLER